MKTFLAWVGGLSLVAWGAAGILCFVLARDRVTLVVQEGEPHRAVPDDPLAPIAARLDALEEGPRALATALEVNLSALDERADARARDVQEALGAELAELRSGLARVQARLAAPAEATPAASAGPGGAELPAASIAAPAASAASGESAPTRGPDGGATLPPAAETARAAPAGEPPAASAAPAGRSSFLAFRLPQDDFRFDERRTWRIVPEQSRVGFDAKSTLHDFSGTTSAVQGTIAFAPARPALDPAGAIAVRAAALSTDNDARDEAMREHLDAARHAEIVFRLASFEPAEVDEAHGLVRGTARGTLVVRGAERPFAMPVRATIDAGRRLLLEGEAPLALPSFGVPVPSKLGLISMEDTVVVWIALRGRLEARESS